MATISARVDDKVKAEAENVANMIGIPLSTAITIFLKRFAADRGFPFDVTATRQTANAYQFEVDALDKMVKKAIAINDFKHPSPVFTYIDPETGELCTKNIQD